MKVLRRALLDASDAIMDWARSKQNNGPFSEEAYRTNIHIAEALRIVAAQLQESPEETK